jgi:hypothetical protein
MEGVVKVLFIAHEALSWFPQVILTSIVYERQKKLRIMMKMHGLGDLPYWTISYCYFLLLSLLYVLAFILYGSVLGMISSS